MQKHILKDTSALIVALFLKTIKENYLDMIVFD